MGAKGGVTSDDVSWKPQMVAEIWMVLLLIMIKGMGNFKTPRRFERENLPEGQCALFDEGYFEGVSFIMVRAAIWSKDKGNSKFCFFEIT